MNRRQLLRGIGAAVFGTGALGATAGTFGCAPGESSEEPEPSGARPTSVPRLPFRISLAQWSLHRDHFGPALETLDFDLFAETLRRDPRSVLQGDLDPLDFPGRARQLGIDGVEYVNTFYYDRAEDREYLADLKARCDAEGVESLLIMCDAEGVLGHPDESVRLETVENHRRWLEAAAFLGCQSIRVNAYSAGSFDEQQKLVADGLRRLCELADSHGLDVLVENHGGFSSHGGWLSGVIQMVDHPRAGTLPDFGNFRVDAEGIELYDRYQGVEQLMPFARAVSAKSYGFDESGAETSIDFERMMEIVLGAGYRGWVGIEYEGYDLPTDEGILATRRLLERVGTELAPRFV